MKTAKQNSITFSPQFQGPIHPHHKIVIVRSNQEFRVFVLRGHWWADRNTNGSFFFVILFHRSAVKFTLFVSSPLSSVPPLLFPPTPPLPLPSPTPLPFYTCHAGYHLWYKLSYMSWNSREVIPSTVTSMKGQSDRVFKEEFFCPWCEYRQVDHKTCKFSFYRRIELRVVILKYLHTTTL